MSDSKHGSRFITKRHTPPPPPHTLVTRRTFLTATAATLATLAGCGGRVPGATPQPADKRTVDSEPGRHRFDFAHDGTPLASVDVRVRRHGGPAAPATVLVSVTPAAGAVTDRLLIGLRAPAEPAVGEPVARVFLAASEAPVSPLTVRATDDRETVVTAEPDGGARESTLVSTFRVVPRAPTTLALRVAVTLRTDDGERVIARVDETVGVPVRPTDGE